MRSIAQSVAGELIALRGRMGAKMKTLIEMTVDGLTTDPNTKQQMVWLRSVEDEVMLPIVIGNTEAMSIYTELGGERTPRPLTHDLFKTVLEHFDAQVEEVRIVDLKDGVFYAELVLSWGGEQICLDARPSDSIALALKYKAPVYMADKVLKEAGYKVKMGQEGLIFVEHSAQQQPGAKTKPSSQTPDSDRDVALSVENLLSAEHAGIEASSRKPAGVEEQIKSLQKQMEQAVKQEAYEEAGQIRDRIARLKGKKGR